MLLEEISKCGNAIYKECDGVQSVLYVSSGAEKVGHKLLPGEDGREAQHLTPAVKIVK